MKHTSENIVTRNIIEVYGEQRIKKQMIGSMMSDISKSPEGEKLFSLEIIDPDSPSAIKLSPEEIQRLREDNSVKLILTFTPFSLEDVLDLVQAERMRCLSIVENFREKREEKIRQQGDDLISKIVIDELRLISNSMVGVTGLSIFEEDAIKKSIMRNFEDKF